MKVQTAGQELAATLRRLHGIGTRSRRIRKGANLCANMLDSIRNATVYPGYYTGDTHAALTAAWAVYNAWQKHVDGYRIPGMLAYQISQLSPYQFAALLGRMIDAGVTNNGEGETFFRNLNLA